MIFFHRSGFDLSPLSHFSAGGQLLHPSEVKSSMSVLCVSPLSNTVAGGVDPGWSANRGENPAVRIITRTRANFICRFYVSRGHRPRLQVRSGNRGHYFFFGSLSAHSFQQMITDSECV